MEIIKINNYKEKRFKTAIALGNFDGVHLGHQSLINSMIKAANNEGLKSSILLFENHTKNIIDGKGPKLLTSWDQKLRIFSELGVDLVYSTIFDKNIMVLSPEEFVKNILIGQLNVKLVTVGYDYKFGHKASGNIETLIELAKKYDFKLNIIEAQGKDKEIISSTKIRGFLTDGNPLGARDMLGRNYLLEGRVVHGKSLGKVLGYPTANLELLDNFLIPKSGVYLTNTIIEGQKYKSVTSIGKNPTFDDPHLKIESHIIGFEREIYEEKIEVEFLEYIRDQIKFENLDDLKEQIKKDVDYAISQY